MKKEKEKEMVEIECDNPGCKKKFNRYIGEYRRSLRMGRTQYCNWPVLIKLATISLNFLKKNESKDWITFWTYFIGTGSFWTYYFAKITFEKYI